jgi:uncharacterized membrane protein YphA (DoxX/SURF4 family)
LIGQDAEDMTRDSKGRRIGYWVTTGFTALGCIVGGMGDLLAPPEVVAIFESLSYPKYIAHFIGVAKLLAALTMLLPKFPRLKEWAYAGLAIDLVGASYSHAATGHAIGDVIMPLVVLAIAMASWYLRPDDRKLADAKV